ncbi:hypothetical protein ETH_00032745, partial [Eimeria tenella]
MGTRTLMSNFVNGKPTLLVVRSNALTTQNPFLIPFFQTFRVQTFVQGTQKPLIKEVGITVKFRNFQPLIEAVAVFENPTATTIKFRYAKLETFFNGSSLGPMVIDRRREPDVIKPSRLSRSSPVAIKPQIKDGTFALVSNVLRSMATNSSEMAFVQ